MAVVKANAYGHGLVPTALALAGADAFAVARLEEGLALRAAGVTQPVVLLEGIFSSEQLLEWTNIVHPTNRDQVTVGALYTHQQGGETFYGLGARALSADGSARNVRSSARSEAPECAVKPKIGPLRAQTMTSPRAMMKAAG